MQCKEIIIFVSCLIVFIIIMSYLTSRESYADLMQPDVDQTNRTCFTQWKLTSMQRARLEDLVLWTSRALSTQNINPPITWIPAAHNLRSIYKSGKLVAEWYDNFEIVILNTQIGRALEHLRTILPQMGMMLTDTGDWFTGGKLYKVSFALDNNSPYFAVHTLTRNGSTPFTWPFIDIFVNVPENDPDMLYNLTAEEVPVSATVDYIQVYIPTVGPRSKGPFLNTFPNIDQEYIHYLSEDHPCIGDPIGPN